MEILGGKTQRLHSLYVPVANKIDYCRYTAWRSVNKKSLVAAVLLMFACYGFVSEVLSWWNSGTLNIVLSVTNLFLSGLAKLLDLADGYENRFTNEETDPDYYTDVQPPDNSWERIDLHMVGGKTEPVFRCRAIDRLLRGDKPLDNAHVR